jgi:hypothetical protein
MLKGSFERRHVDALALVKRDGGDGDEASWRAAMFSHHG